MPLTDLPIDALRDYRPEVREPEDFDAFWADTLQESRSFEISARLTPADTPITELIVEDLTFSGFRGEPIRAWVIRPRGTDAPLPAVVQYNGYNGGRGIAGERVLWALSGYVQVFMDTRGQGSGWGSGGDTPDPHGSAPATAGFMTRGIGDPSNYFYRRLFTDGVRLIDTVRSLPFVDADRIAVTGGSQGGAISMAVAALVPGLTAVMPDVPYLCHFRRAAEIAIQPPFTELVTYLSVHRLEVERVFDTLSYFDGVNFARRITAPALFSVALMDQIVPPSTVFAAYNRLDRSPAAEIEVYPFNGHEGGDTYQWLRQSEWVAPLFLRD